MHVVKGHGTGNDFVVVPDLDDELTLSPALVRALCDRRSGIGADGVLRVVRSDDVSAPWFMDYRNADGSLAEMCGNGVRVFVRYLQRAGLLDGASEVTVGTRAGARRATIGADGAITVDMGAPAVLDMQPKVSVAGAVLDQPGRAVEMPNPHVVVVVSDADAVAALDLSRAPVVEPALPHGQNVEFVAYTGERAIFMRVHERGVGETRSCGTGICAVVAAAVAYAGGDHDPVPWTVRVPGGVCTVHWTRPESILLSGPAEIVADLVLDDTWLAAARRA